MKKYISQLLLCSMFILGGIHSTSAQALERSVLASCGQNLSNPTYSMQFTMGEPVAGTIANGTELTLGFQQEWLVVTAVVDPGVEQLEAKVYPNPTFGKVNIETDEQIQASVFDLTGNSLRFTSMSSGKNEMDITQLPAGMYILVLQNKEGNKTSSFKLQKAE